MSLDQITVVVFDFDLCITQKHSCSISKDTFMSLPLSESLADPLVFRNLVHLLLRSGIKVAIASFGHKEIILHTMRRLFKSTPGDCPFNEDNIITPADASREYSVYWPEGYEPPPGYSKSDLIVCLQRKMRSSIPESQILLIDDSLTNCMDAIKHSYSAKLCCRLSRNQGLECLCRDAYHEIPPEMFYEAWNSFISCP